MTMKSPHILVACAAAALLVLSAVSPAQACRLALVVGNADYSFGRLRNPVNDATDMAQALDDVGFRVTTVTDVDKERFARQVERFCQTIRQDDVAMFYYAGHAVQINNRNYLLGTDSGLSENVSIERIGLDLQDIMNRMATADMSIVVLDACRVNPYAGYYLSGDGETLTRSFRGIQLRPQQGLANARRAKGTFIAFATDIGMVAYDGKGRNGTFTKYLLKHIRTPGYRLEDVFKRVREDVARETGDRQIPWDSSSLTGLFYFVKPQDKHIYKKNPKAFVPAF